MDCIVVPVRYPLSMHSRETLAEAISIADENDAELTVLHVNLYQNGKDITRASLRRAVEREFGALSNTRFIVRSGFLIEESILNEAVAEEADVVVIGHKQIGRLRRIFRRLYNEPDIEKFLRARLSCEIVTVGRD
ncbi:universal stress protein [Halostella pelagica]|uniref:universal stress protein n=1 Tax=Halostella pelagica TaxID=2583824 RepID=UPI00107FE50A|nr:universal stress protein [Halostella pelagica]